jgi:phosphoribosylaminoimidazolecarboxamide formyltransferase / IMP cyclohydrolase
LKALFSLNNVEDALPFAAKLMSCGWTIIATKNVAMLLKQNDMYVQDVADFLKISEIYPFPPTLHPKMELALTTNIDESIQLVFNTTYPLSEGNDVGGHTLLALAAKGSRIVVSDNDDMKKVVEQIQTNGKLKSEFQQHLIHKANEKISKHYLSLYRSVSNSNGKLSEGLKKAPLKEGENPYQVPANHLVEDFEDELSLGNFERISGELPCFTNMADLDSTLKIICSLSEACRKNFSKTPHILVAAKHGNPCGLGVDWAFPTRALDLALFGNPRSIWGGEVIANFRIDLEIGEMLLFSHRRKELLENSYWMLDLIAAPSFDKEAIETLGKREERKLFSNTALFNAKPDPSEWNFRSVRGGNLQQPPNNYILDFSDCEKPIELTENRIKISLIVAWAAAWHSNHGGNEVAIAKDGQLLGIGGGPSTIEAAATAVHRAKACGHDLQNSVFSADAFFPFTDAPEVLIKAGCGYGLVPGGGMNFDLVKKFFIDQNVKVYYLPSSIRGFCRH